jgi:hypothetical protein
VSLVSGSNFAADVIDTGGNLPQVSLTKKENLSPVSTTPAISKNLNDPNVIFRVLGEDDS